MHVSFDDATVVAANERSASVESLEQLPDRMTSLELQISQFREEVRVEFSTTRGEMMNRMNELHGVAMNRIHELSTEMRVLHEEVISRIALLNEGLNHRRRMKRHPPKR